MQDIPLQCECGQVQGIATNISPQTANRVVCYCDDCQAFATYLGQTESTLDPSGGTDIFQVTPPQITITQGVELLRCLRLTPGGLIRWYSSCCHTPIANTVSGSVPFVGLVHSFVQDPKTYNSVLGPVRFYIFGSDAKGTVPTECHPKTPFGLLARNIPWILWAKIRGMSQPSPFFLDSGQPISQPHILKQD